MPVTDVMGLKKKIVDNLNAVYRSFPVLFGVEEEQSIEIDPEDFGGGGEDKPKVDTDSSKAANFHERWGWYVILDMLSKSDPLKWDALGEIQYEGFLGIVAFYKDKRLHEYELEKRRRNG